MCLTNLFTVPLQSEIEGVNVNEASENKNEVGPVSFAEISSSTDQLQRGGRKFKED
jgi:hypothetical protein